MSIYMCSNLTQVAIPDSVTVVGQYAFAFDGKLATVIVGKGLKTFMAGPFFQCTNLEGVYFRGQPPQSDAGAVFGNSPMLVCYYLPGTAGWGTSFEGHPALPWNPQVQTDGSGFGVSSNQFGFSIIGSYGLNVVVEGCADLTNPNWVPLQTNRLLGACYFTDLEPTNYPARFYRLRSP